MATNQWAADTEQQRPMRWRVWCEKCGLRLGLRLQSREAAIGRGRAHVPRCALSADEYAYRVQGFYVERTSPK